MPFIADLYRMSLPLAWSLRLEGKTDQERFSDKELNWGLRTWDLWNFNKCDERFGDNWPGRIPAQLVAHTLFYCGLGMMWRHGRVARRQFCAWLTDGALTRRR